MIGNVALLSARYLYGIAVLLGILQAGHWVEVNAPALASSSLPMSVVQANFDLGMRIGIIATIGGMVIRIGLEAWRLYRTRQAMAGPAIA